MGLDMFLTGKKYFFGWGDDKPEEDGYPLKTKELELGYWRKHPNLHGFIVKTFGGDVDDCQQIDLAANDIDRIIRAIRNNELPHTTGFFFGASPSIDDAEYYEEQKNKDIETFAHAIDWLKELNNKEFRSVYYQASW